LATILRPWGVALALLAIADAALIQSLSLPGPGEPLRFPPFYGAGLEVKSGEGVLNRILSIKWSAKLTNKSLTWSDRGEWYGVRWTRSGWAERPESDRPALSRPPNAPIDSWELRIDLLWWMGLPLISSILSVWRSRRHGLQESSSGSKVWRWMRPWVFTFGPIGLLIAATGGFFQLWEPDGLSETYGAGTHFEAANQRVGSTRRMVINAEWVRFASAEATAAATFVDRQWGSHWLALGAVERANLISLSNGRPAVSRNWMFFLGLWWLVAAPACFNLITLIRLVWRRRGAKE
ncbi:MAG: hypothetical protein AAF907_02230, partial [Planctomycetota bacterium]